MITFQYYSFIKSLTVFIHELDSQPPQIFQSGSTFARVYHFAIPDCYWITSPKFVHLNVAQLTAHRFLPCWYLFHTHTHTHTPLPTITTRCQPHNPKSHHHHHHHHQLLLLEVVTSPLQSLLAWSIAKHMMKEMCTSSIQPKPNSILSRNVSHESIHRNSSLKISFPRPPSLSSQPNLTSAP